MRRFIRLYCVLILFLAVSLQAAGQPSYIFHHLSTDEGLSNSNVRTILKDSYGFLWIGTDLKYIPKNLRGITHYGKTIFWDCKKMVWATFG
jgi:hypothetical protein